MYINNHGIIHLIHSCMILCLMYLRGSIHIYIAVILSVNICTRGIIHIYIAVILSVKFVLAAAFIYMLP